MAMVGTVEQRVSAGVIVECRPHRPVASRMGSVGGGGGVWGGFGNDSDVFGRFLLRNHPDRSKLVDDDRIDVQAIEDGIYQRNGETLRAYWCVGTANQPLPQAQPQKSIPPTQWKSSLDAPTR